MRVIILFCTLLLVGCSYPTYNIVKDSYNTFSPTYSPSYSSSYASSNIPTNRSAYKQNPIASSKTPKKASKVRIIVAGSPKRYGD